MFFGKRTAEIQKQSVNGVFVEKVVEIFRLSHAETQIGELEFYFRFRARYKNIRCFFYRDKVDVGVLPRKFNRETAFSATYFKVEWVVVSERFL